jgi:hypothetical protein
VRSLLPQIGAPGNDLRARDAGPIRDLGRALEIVAAAGKRDAVTRRVLATRATCAQRSTGQRRASLAADG